MYNWLALVVLITFWGFGYGLGYFQHQQPQITSLNCGNCTNSTYILQKSGHTYHCVAGSCALLEKWNKETREYEEF